LAGYGFRVPNQRVRGREVAGRVEAVGKNVTTLNPGDDAFGIAEGSFAEYTVGRAEKLAPKPTNLTFQQAAATTISAVMTVADISGGMPAPIIKPTPFVIRTAGVDAPLASKCSDRWLVLRVPGDPQDGMTAS
jgi:threonine dehydrogenase-like Zn-dependent dehydrogenase